MDTDNFKKLWELLSDSEDGTEPDEKHLPAPHASSVLIDKFIQADLDAGMESCEMRPQGDPQHLDDLLHNTVRTFFASTSFPSGAFSVSVNLLDFPPTLSMRSPTKLLRPVIIDGCAVCGCFDNTYSPHWGNIKDTATVSWTSCKVLTLKPIFKCVVQFLLRGHKVSVLLPSYYRVSPFTGIRMKVDNAEAFNTLLNLRIVQFIESGKAGTIADVIKQKVREVEALLVSSESLDVRHNAQGTSSSQPGTSTDANPKLHPAFTSASERMVTPIFFGRNKNMAMVFNFNVKQGGTWQQVPEALLCNYDSMDSSRNIDELGRLSQQLLFQDQVELLTAIKDVFEWQAIERYGIAAILRLNFLKSLSD